MRLAKLGAAAVLAALALSGCGGSSVSEGTVIAKEYDDPDSWVYMQPNYMTTCSNNVCTQRLIGFTTIPMQDGPHWRLRLKQGDKADWAEVGADVFAEYRVGDYYTGGGQ